MNCKIRPQDIKPKDFLFVCEWLDEAVKEVSDHEDWFLGRTPRKKPIGDPLRVCAVAFPFITVELLATGVRGVLDTRAAVFMKVDRAYIRSLLPNFGKKPIKTVPIATKHRYDPKTKKWNPVIEELS